MTARYALEPARFAVAADDFDVLNIRLPPETMEACKAAAKVEGFNALAEWCRVTLKREATRILAEAPAPVSTEAT